MTGVAEQGSYRRNWWAIALATVVMFVSFGSLLVAVSATQSDSPDSAGPAFALGFALVPIVYVTLAFVSGRERAPGSVLKSMGIWILVALPLGLFNPVFGLSVGFGTAGIVSLHLRDGDSQRGRLVGVFAVCAYSFLMLYLIPPLGLLSAGLLPLAALGLADYYTEHRGT